MERHAPHAALLVRLMVRKQQVGFCGVLNSQDIGDKRTHCLTGVLIVAGQRPADSVDHDKPGLKFGIVLEPLRAFDNSGNSGFAAAQVDRP
jgi:hypothetical protein